MREKFVFLYQFILNASTTELVDLLPVQPVDSLLLFYIGAVGHKVQPLCVYVLKKH